MKNEDLLDIKPKKDLKKPLIFGAIAFLIFIIVVIGIALFQNSNKKESNEIIPPETTQKTDSFKPLSVEEEKPQEESLNLNGPENKNSQKETKSLKEEKPTQEKKVQEKPVVKENPELIQSKTNNLNKSNEIINKPIKHIKNKKHEKAFVVRNYYIQVAALLKNSKPNKKFLKLITSEGFKYKLYTTYIRKNNQKIKVTKVLIGPFTKLEAKKILPKIKNTISQTAYILKVKNGI